MKSIRTYIPSLFISVILVLLFLGGSAVVIADINITSEHFRKTASEKNIEAQIYTSIEKNYREKANATGIPANVYTDHLSEEYLASVMNVYIDAGFKTLSDGSKFAPQIPVNPELEASIDKFFNDYADKTGYKKDDKFEKKLAKTKEEAYKLIGSQCDAFKFSALNSHGAMKSISKIYSHRIHIAVIISAAALLLLAVMFIINRKNKKSMLYWCGVSALISGIIGTIPSAVLVADRYFDSFSIKQPQIFTAYTTTFYRLTEAFMAAHIAFAAIGITMLVIYGVLCGINKNNIKSPADIEVKEKSDEIVSAE